MEQATTDISSPELALLEQASKQLHLLKPALNQYLVFPLKRSQSEWERTAAALLSDLGFAAYDLWEVRMPHQPTYRHIVAGPPGMHNRENQYWIFPGGDADHANHAKTWIKRKKTPPDMAIWRQLRDPFDPGRRSFLLAEIPKSFVGAFNGGR